MFQQGINSTDSNYAIIQTAIISQDIPE